MHSVSQILHCSVLQCDLLDLYWLLSSAQYIRLVSYIKSTLYLSMLIRIKDFLNKFELIPITVLKDASFHY